MNLVVLKGNLVRDVERRALETGSTVVRFTVAVKRRRKGKDGEYGTSFVNCVAFGTTAELISKYFVKGSPIIVTDGEWVSGSYEKQDGTKVYTNECYVNSFDFCGKGEVKAEPKPEPKTDILDDPMFMPLDDDQLPF